VVHNVWHKDNFSFTYFPEPGHALDPRTSYDDLQYDLMSADARQALIDKLGAFFIE